MSALIWLVVFAALAWSVAKERQRTRRWREAERLSRCLFAAAGAPRSRQGRTWVR
jgi:hypothetical protein